MGNAYLSLTAGEIVDQEYETNMQNLNIAPSQHMIDHVEENTDHGQLMFRI